MSREKPAAEVHRRGSVPPFDPEAHGEKISTAMFWGRNGCKKLPSTYWNQGFEERDTPDIKRVLRFLQMRKDWNGNSIADKLGKPVKREDGWWCLPIKSCNRSVDATRLQVAWHGTQFLCIYSVLFQGRLLESKDVWNTKQSRDGVYCHGGKSARKADNYMVFQQVFSDGAWWGAKFELLVDRECGMKAGDQWVQPADSIQIIALWLCGRSHTEMQNGCCFEPKPWNPLGEVNPHTVSHTVCAKQEQQIQKQDAITMALRKSLRQPKAPTAAELAQEVTNEMKALQAREDALLPISAGTDADRNGPGSSSPGTESVPTRGSFALQETRSLLAAGRTRSPLAARPWQSLVQSSDPQVRAAVQDASAVSAGRLPRRCYTCRLEIQSGFRSIAHPECPFFVCSLEHMWTLDAEWVQLKCDAREMDAAWQRLPTALTQ